MLLETLLRPDFFKALADPNRIKLLCKLCQCKAGCCVQEAADCCDVDLSVVSRHLAQLCDAGLLCKQKRGKQVHYKIDCTAIVKTLREIATEIENCCSPQGADGGCCGETPNHPNQRRRPMSCAPKRDCCCNCSCCNCCSCCCCTDSGKESPKNDSGCCEPKQD